MQAHATAKRSRLNPGSAPLSPNPSSKAQAQQMGADFGLALMDGLLGRLVDLVVDRLMERTTANAGQLQGEWLDARGAADYLGIHCDTLRKLAAERGITAHQDGPGCKLYFRRGELDHWRRSSKAARSRLRPAS